MNTEITGLTSITLKESPSMDFVTPPEPPLYDLDILYSSGKEDDEFIKNLLTIFVDSMPDGVQEIKAAAESRNFELLRKAAHKMKSSIDLLGIDSLKGTIRNLEMMTEDDPELNHQIEFLTVTMQHVVKQLSALL